MRNIKSTILYLFVLTFEIIRIFSLVFIEKNDSSVISLFQFSGFALLCIPAIIIFLIMNNEKEFYHFFKLVVVVKLFLIVSFFIYIISNVGALIQYIKIFNINSIFIHITIPIFLLFIDIFIMFFCRFREKYLCKLFQ